MDISFWWVLVKFCAVPIPWLCIPSRSRDCLVIINYSVTTLAPIVVIEVDQSSQCFLFLKDNLNRGEKRNNKEMRFISNAIWAVSCG
ncbi:hypothetical protein NXS19_012167 [Fusarium pseudograminearum]|nr:hypothetical protein NXS19_012167 [Fusarium pseudograminearum]